MADDVHEHIKTYVEAAARATTRGRDILVLIIIVSVLIFGAFWNSRQGSWGNSRIRSTADVLRLQNLLSQRATANDPEAISALDKQLADPKFERVREYVEIRPFLNQPGAAAEMLKKLEEIQTEHVLYLRLPFFGLIVDVNDLGMLGGFAFTVLLLWFRFALWHERANLEMTFAEGERHHSRKFAMKLCR